MTFSQQLKHDTWIQIGDRVNFTPESELIAKNSQYVHDFLILLCYTLIELKDIEPMRFDAKEIN